jgi:hypothetical protein
LDVFILDFDRFCREPRDTFAELLNWIGRPIDWETLRDNIASFWSEPASALSPGAGGDALPDDIQKLYSDLLKSTFRNKDNGMKNILLPRRGGFRKSKEIFPNSGKTRSKNR